MSCQDPIVPKSIAEIAEELYSERAAGTLYHYTSLSGLRGIVESHSLFITDSRFLNDASEVKHTSTLLLAAITRRGVSRALTTLRKDWDRRLDLQGQLLEVGRSVVQRLLEQNRVYLGSITGNGNLLSQWRGYCPAKGGVSVGFDAEQLSVEATRQGMLIGRCIYARDHQEEIANSIVAAVEQRLRRGRIPHFWKKKSGGLCPSRE